MAGVAGKEKQLQNVAFPATPIIGPPRFMSRTNFGKLFPVACPHQAHQGLDWNLSLPATAGGSQSKRAGRPCSEMANVALLSASSPSTSSAASLLPRRHPSRSSACFPRVASKLSVVAAMGDDPIKEWILTEGKATKITGTSSIGGGCINAAQRYETDAGSFFVKTNRCAKANLCSKLSMSWSSAQCQWQLIMSSCPICNTTPLLSTVDWNHLVVCQAHRSSYV
ncbi:hypothetical protein ACQ4PT_003628 [Festuca glaucescens]